MHTMKRYPICFWPTTSMDKATPATADMWRDLGITLAMSPQYGAGKREAVAMLLDRAASHDIRVILCDDRLHWRTLTRTGEAEYRRLFAEALRDFGSHPAVFGFFVGDEPDAPDAADAFKAMRIQQEMAPALTAYLNLLPWFDWIGERMGTPALAPYLDRVKAEGHARLLSYDCYAQMWEGEKGYGDYFGNLREYYLATQRLGLPFFNIVLSCGHYHYRCPSKDDMQWQLGTSVAHGASGVSWFFIELPGIWDNYRNVPINPLGERTEQFAWLSEVNRVFNNYCGEIVATLTIDTCHHVGKAYGGMPLFEPSGNVLAVSADVPLVFSRFHDEARRTYYMVCCNSPQRTTQATLRFAKGLSLEKCDYGNTFSAVRPHTDPIGRAEGEGGQTVNVFLAPGQLALYREL